MVVITPAGCVNHWWSIGGYNGKNDTLILVVITGFFGGYPDLHGVCSLGGPLVRPTKWWAHRELCTRACGVFAPAAAAMLVADA
jgi:hypothetical protein